MIMWVEKQENGKFKFVERYTDYITGKQKKVSVTLDKNTAQSRKMAERLLQDKMTQFTPVQQKNLTLQELIEEYRKDQAVTVKQSTYKRNYFACKTLAAILGEDTLIERLNANYVRTALLSTRKEPGTLNEHLVRFKALIRWGYHNDLVTDISYLDKLEPFKDVPHREKIQDKFLESSEVHLLLKAMKVPKWKLLTQFLVLSGLRFGEAASLLKNDVDLDERLIHVTKTWDSVNKIVNTPKTLCSIRDVFIQDELIDVCKKIKICMIEERLLNGYEPSNLFFEGINGKHIDYYAYNKYLRENTLSALHRTITPHTLRHTHASLLMEQGVNIDIISRRLGHETSAITREIYLHVTEKLKEKDNQEIKNIKII